MQPLKIGGTPKGLQSQTSHQSNLNVLDHHPRSQKALHCLTVCRVIKGFVTPACCLRLSLSLLVSSFIAKDAMSQHALHFINGLYAG